MHDHGEEAAAVLGEPGWLRLGTQHAMLVRRGERPRRRITGEPHQIIDGTAMTKIMGQAGLLGVPAADGGFGDEQAMRLLMLQARLGRRINELCMLDHDPLTMLGCPLSRSGPGRVRGPAALSADQDRRRTRHDPRRRRDRRDHPRRSRTGPPGVSPPAAGPAAPPVTCSSASMMNRNGDRPYHAGQVPPPAHRTGGACRDP